MAFSVPARNMLDDEKHRGGIGSAIVERERANVIARTSRAAMHRNDNQVELCWECLLHRAAYAARLLPLPLCVGALLHIYDDESAAPLPRNFRFISFS